MLNTAGGSGVLWVKRGVHRTSIWSGGPRAGDRRAFGALVGRYMRAAYAVSLSVTGRHDDAEDAAQEGFMVALERLDDCRAPDRFVGWLMTIVRNRARNLVRREVLRDTDAVPESTAARGRNPGRGGGACGTSGNSWELRSGGCRRSKEKSCSFTISRAGAIGRSRSASGSPRARLRSHLHFARKSLRRDADLAQVAIERGPTGHVQIEDVPQRRPGRDVENVPIGSDSQDMKNEESENLQSTPSIGRTA